MGSDKPKFPGYTSAMFNYAQCDAYANREAAAASYVCGCFHCLQIFFSEEIRFWVGGNSAVCPLCGEISVLPDSSQIPISGEFLREMQARFFPECVKICVRERRWTRRRMTRIPLVKS